MLRPGHRPDLSCPAAALAPPGSGSSLGLGHCSASSVRSPSGEAAGLSLPATAHHPLHCQPVPAPVKLGNALCHTCFVPASACKSSQRGLDNCGLSSGESSSRAFGGGFGGRVARPQWLLSLPAPPRHRGLSSRQVQWRAGRRSPARRPTQAWCENLQQLQLKVSSRAVRAAHEEARAVTEL